MAKRGLASMVKVRQKKVLLKVFPTSIFANVYTKAASRLLNKAHKSVFHPWNLDFQVTEFSKSTLQIYITDVF